MLRFNRKAAILAGCCASALLSAPAWAADEPAGISAGTDIVVTARKREESLIDVPVSITALDKAGIEARGIVDLNGLNDFTPGLRYENSSVNRNDRSFYTITMRGMFPGDSPNRPGVTVFIDGVPIPGGAMPGMTDVEQVEVVKGPQSAYFGRATFAGAMNFITTAPSLTEFKGRANVSYASYGTTDDTVTLEGPIIADKLAVRLSGRYYHTDGQYKNTGFGGRLGERNTHAISGSFIGKPADNLTIRGYLTAWKDNDGPSAQSIITEGALNCFVGGTARRSTLNGFNDICSAIKTVPRAYMSQSIVANGQTNFDFLNNGAILPKGFIDQLGLKRKEYISNTTAKWELEGFEVAGSYGQSRNQYAAITDTYNRPADGTGYYSVAFLPYDIKNQAGELRVANTGSALGLMLGGNYYHETIDFEGRAYRPNAGVATITQILSPTQYESTTYGIFGSVNYDITDRLSASAEGRYQWDVVHHQVLVTNGFNRQQTFKSFSPRVIVNYKIADRTNLYVSYARGTRPGVFNSAYAGQSTAVQTAINASAAAQGLTVPIAVPEEKLTNFEAGIKGDFFDRRLRILLNGYYGKWRDRQITQGISILQNGSQQSTAIVFPNGKTDLWGTELEATLHVTPEFDLSSTFNWAHTKILYTQCSDCAAENGVLNPEGKLMERYPVYSGTVSASYTRPIGGEWSLFGRSDVIYTGKQYATEANVAHIAAATRVNLRIGVSDERYSIELFGTNVLDNKRPVNIIRAANPSANTAQSANLFIVSPPERATVGVRGTAKF